MLLTLFQGFATPFTFQNLALLLLTAGGWALLCMWPLTWIGRWFFAAADRTSILLVNQLVGLSLIAAVLYCIFAVGGGGAFGGLLIFLLPLLAVLKLLFGTPASAVLLPPLLIAAGLGVIWLFYLPFDALTGGGGAGFVAFVLMLVQWWRVFYQR